MKVPPIQFSMALTAASISILMILLSGCLAGTPLPPIPTDTPTPTQTSTPTVIWFPPTSTSTPIPTVMRSPTPELRPGIGSSLLNDDFRTIEHWVAGNPGHGTVALGLDEISLAITQPRGYLFSFRDEPTLDNFYLEITASPSLCTGSDEYGLLLRYNSPVDFYRLSLSCDGRTRLDKLVGGTASSPQLWLGSSSIPSAAPSSSRIGVWAVGNEFRFFINDEFQFGINDRILSHGLIGVFARSGGENAVTVSFSNLVIYQVLP